MHRTCHLCTLLTLFENCTEAVRLVDATNAFKRLNGDLAQNTVSTQIVSKSFLNGLQHKLKFIAGITPNSHSLLREVEQIKDKIFILSMLKHPSYNDKSRKVFSFQVKDGGLSIILPDDRANEEKTSNGICEPLQNYSAEAAGFHQEKFLQ